MRGEDRRTGQLFSYVDLESRVRADHPLRVIREVVNAALAALCVTVCLVVLVSIVVHGMVVTPAMRLLDRHRQLQRRESH